MPFKRSVAIVFCVCLLGTGLPVPAQAALIASDQLLPAEPGARARIDI